MSHRRYTESALVSHTTTDLRANTTLLGLGILALVVVIFATVAVIGFGGLTGDFSPIDVASAQSTNQTEATITINNQTSNGSTVAIENATLPNGGFLVIHTSEYANDVAPADSSVIATSNYLSAGNYTNVTVSVSNAPPGNYPGLNRSQLNSSQTVGVTVYRDTNGNQRFDFVQSFGENDTAYTSDGQSVSNTAGISVPSAEEERQTASVTFNNQTLQNGTLVVDQARLPKGGFLVAHNESFQRTGDGLTSAVGLSAYLPPGNHTDIPLAILPAGLNQTQTVTVRPSLDTNDNQQYDYIRSDGLEDVAYETLNRSGTVTETAQVTVSSPVTASPQTHTEIRTKTKTKTETTTASSPTTTEPVPPDDSPAGPLDSFGLVVVAILALIAGVIIVIRGLR